MFYCGTIIVFQYDEDMMYDSSDSCLVINMNICMVHNWQGNSAVLCIDTALTL